MGFSYERPRTAEALDVLLAEAGAEAAILAGGTDLLVQLRARARAPRLVIDLKRVEGMGRIEHHPGGGVTLGAAVTMNRLIDDARMPRPLAALASAARQVATYAIRNRATVAGNVANGSPCADTVPPLCVLGASVELRSRAGTRRLTLPELITGVRTLDRRPDEWLSAVHLPAWSEDVRTGFMKRQRVRGHDLALVNAAVLLDREGGALRIAVGAASPAPVLLTLEAGTDPEDAARAAMAAIRPISDVRASAEYRTDMTGVLVRRLLALLAEEVRHAA